MGKLLDDIVDQYKKDSKAPDPVEEPRKRFRVQDEDTDEEPVPSADNEEPAKKEKVVRKRMEKPEKAPVKHRAPKGVSLTTIARIGTKAYEMSMIGGMTMQGYQLDPGEQLAIVKLTPINA